MACLDESGLAEINTLIDCYLENASILRETMESIGYVRLQGIRRNRSSVGTPREHGRVVERLFDHSGKDADGDDLDPVEKDTCVFRPLLHVRKSLRPVNV